MRKMKNEFIEYATKHRGINSLTLNKYQSSIKPIGYISPMIIEERQMNVATMSVFDRLQMDRIIFLGTNIDDTVSNIIQAQLLFLESVDKTKDIQMFIQSGGGSIYAGLGIYDTMQYVQPDIATISIGLSASMAAVLLCAGTKGKRSSLKHSRILIHQPLGGTEGQASDILIVAKEIQILKNELYQIISDHSGQDILKIEKDADRDYWMTASEAKEYGLIDEVITKRIITI